MDVVNGKIVSARTERSRSDIWRALKPSRGLLQEAGPCPQAGKPAAGSLRGYSLPVVPGAAAFDQAGWKWSSSWNADQSPSWGRDLHHKWSSPSSSEFVSRAFLDKELDMCESRVSRAVVGRFASPTSVGQVTPMTSVTPAVTSDAPLLPGAPAAANPLKRPHSEIDQVLGLGAELDYASCLLLQSALFTRCNGTM